MLRDIVYFTSQKLQNDWSAADFAKNLTAENLQALLPKYDRLDPLVRVRLLLSVLTVDQKKLAAIETELQVWDICILLFHASSLLTGSLKCCDGLYAWKISQIQCLVRCLSLQLRRDDCLSSRTWCPMFWCVQETYMMYMNNTGCCEYLFECKWKHCLKFVPVQTQF